MYLVYFMMIYGFIQVAIINISDIWIEELPNCDRILKVKERERDRRGGIRDYIKCFLYLEMLRGVHCQRL